MNTGGVRMGFGFAQTLTEDDAEIDREGLPFSASCGALQPWRRAGDFRNNNWGTQILVRHRTISRYAKSVW